MNTQIIKNFIDLNSFYLSNSTFIQRINFGQTGRKIMNLVRSGRIIIDWTIIKIISQTS